MSCPFCNLDPKRNPIIFEDEYCFVIPSNPRLVAGHLLVIPKRHIEKPSELSDEERSNIFDTILAYQDKVVANLSQGCDIRENYRPFQPENDLKVNHIHFHLIPRELNDEIYEKYEKYQRDVFKKVTDNELEESLKLFGEAK